MKKYELSDRGFYGYRFKDSYGCNYSIQESSAIQPSIWLGMNENDVKVRLFLPDVNPDLRGWMDYPLPEQVKIFNKLHLTQEQVKEILPYLQYFIEHGELPHEEIK